MDNLNKTFFKLSEITCECEYLDWKKIGTQAKWLAYDKEEQHFHLLDKYLRDFYVNKARKGVTL